MEAKLSTMSSARKGPDLILRLIDLLSVVLWGFEIVNFSLIVYAKPVDETFFDRLLHISVRDYWDFQLLRLALILSLVQLFISLISLYLNSKRLKRKNDRIRISIVISLFTSLILCLILTAIIFFR